MGRFVHLWSMSDKNLLTLHSQTGLSQSSQPSRQFRSHGQSKNIYKYHSKKNLVEPNGPFDGRCLKDY